MNLQVSAASMTGCIRENNEDMVLVGKQFVRNDSCRRSFSIGSYDRLILALADGMGGHSSGEVASSDVLSNLNFFFNDLPKGLNTSAFNEAICGWNVSINNIIDSKGRTELKYRDMGTTLVALAFYEGEIYWMNCGDSRLYRYSNGVLQQVTTDHSLSNLIGQKEHSNIITNCIGGGCKTSYIDLMRYTKQVNVGDTFLLCSDGLNDMISDAEIANILSEGGDATQLCDAAIAAGGFDNVTTCVIKIEN